MSLDEVFGHVPRVYNIKKDLDIPPNAINVMRPSKFGNPFVKGIHGDRDTVCDKFKEYVDNNPDLIAYIKKELKGKDLICCCHPKRCHAHYLLIIANG